MYLLFIYFIVTWFIVKCSLSITYFFIYLQKKWIRWIDKRLSKGERCHILKNDVVDDTRDYVKGKKQNFTNLLFFWKKKENIIRV